MARCAVRAALRSAIERVVGQASSLSHGLLPDDSCKSCPLVRPLCAGGTPQRDVLTLRGAATRARKLDSWRATRYTTATPRLNHEPLATPPLANFHHGVDGPGFPRRGRSATQLHRAPGR